jgi:phosphoenolpyruvate synthase/pyruvate phosphate dikinase
LVVPFAEVLAFGFTLADVGAKGYRLAELATAVAEVAAGRIETVGGGGGGGGGVGMVRVPAGACLCTAAYVQHLASAAVAPAVARLRQVLLASPQHQHSGDGGDAANGTPDNGAGHSARQGTRPSTSQGVGVVVSNDQRAADAVSEEAVAEALRELRTAIIAAPLDPDVSGAVASFCDIECGKGDAGAADRLRFAVRSSGSLEDQAEHSFAGQYDTVLNVPAAAVADAVKQCWASQWGEHAVK